MNELYIRSEGQDFRMPDYTLANEEDLRKNPIVKKLMQDAYNKGQKAANDWHESNARWDSISKYGDMGT